MTKATCTPHRKAFAMRSKHHDLEETEVSENRCEDYPCCGHGDGGCLIVMVVSIALFVEENFLKVPVHQCVQNADRECMI